MDVSLPGKIMIVAAQNDGWQAGDGWRIWNVWKEIDEDEMETQNDGCKFLVRKNGIKAEFRNKL